MATTTKTASAEIAAYHQPHQQQQQHNPHHHHHHQRQAPPPQFLYHQTQEEHSDGNPARSDYRSVLPANMSLQQAMSEHDDELAGKYKRICFGATAEDHVRLEPQIKESTSSSSTFVIPLPMNNNANASGSAQRPVIQFQHHHLSSPPRASQSPSHQTSPSSSSSSSSSQNSRRDHNIDYSTLFVQLSGTFPTLYRCVNCHKTVSNRWHHANIHRPQSHACPICGQKFTRRDNMKAHCKIKHADLRTSPSGGPSAGAGVNLNNGDQGYFTHFVQM